jgi:glutamyl endopeptidase
VKWLILQKKYKPVVPDYGKNRPLQESVIGDDSRYRIYPSESGYPERAIGQITFTKGGQNFICTGWMYSKDTVGTAGHCVHSGGPSGVWHTNVKFYPGKNGASLPFGFCTAKRLSSVDGWVKSKLDTYDYGAIKLNCNVGNNTGWFGIFWQNATLAGFPVQVSGYPGDKTAGTQWSTSGDIGVSEAKKSRYKHDSYGGQSGGPVFQTDRIGPSCNGPCVNSIHAYGVQNGWNSGTRINQEVYNNLILWRNTP